MGPPHAQCGDSICHDVLAKRLELKRFVLETTSPQKANRQPSMEEPTRTFSHWSRVSSGGFSKVTQDMCVSKSARWLVIFRFSVKAADNEAPYFETDVLSSLAKLQYGGANWQDVQPNGHGF